MTMRSHLVRYGKLTVTALNNIYRPKGQKDIIISSLPRSGSTWLMEMCYSQPGVTYVREPLDKKILDYHQTMPFTTRYMYGHLTADEAVAFKKFFHDKWQLKRFGPVNVRETGFNFRTNRRVIKTIRCAGIIDWVTENLDMHSVYLIRHPISQSLSCIRRGHRSSINDYIDHHQYVERWLNAPQYDLAAKIMKEGDPLEQFVTEWCLGNLPALRLEATHQNNGWHTVTYEALTLNPESVLKTLSKQLNLTDWGAILQAINRPSRVTNSSTQQTKANILSGDRTFLIEKWKKDVSDDDEKRLFDILETFEIDIYQRGEVLPKNINAPSQATTDRQLELS